MEKSWLKNQENGVYYVTQPKSAFEEVYTEVRQKENRLLTDDLVQLLPSLPESHAHHSEWLKRQYTVSKFHEYLQNKSTYAILEIGCGNGWFANSLTPYAQEVVGIDVGKQELEQAARCFKKNNLKFVCCNNWGIIPDKSFEIIVFNASIQYFDINAHFWKSLSRILTQNGEIHILDSPIYSKTEVKSAQKRSKTYFEQLQNPKASLFYKHLTWDQFPKKSEKKYHPKGILQRFKKSPSPFPWICISAKALIK